MSVHRDADSWRVKWRENGRQRSRSFDRKRDADAWDREVRRRQQLGLLAVQVLTDRGPTLGEWITEHWAREHGATLARRTRDRYASSYDLHVAPWLEDVPLRELGVAKLRAWQADRLANGASAETVRKARTLLSSVLRHAAESEVIPSNPLAVIRAPATTLADEVVPLAPLRSRQCARYSPRRCGSLCPTGSERVASGARTRCLTGARPRSGRATPRWSRYWRTAASARARRRHSDGRTSASARSSCSERPTPTARSRRRRDAKAGRCGCSACSSKTSRQWREASDGREAKLVFPRSDGAAWTKEDWGNWRSRTWHTACRHAGLDHPPRPYDLRHSFASLLLAEGRTIHYVAAQLGHSPAETLRTYGHVIAEFEDAGRIDAEAEIQAARSTACSARVPSGR